MAESGSNGAITWNRYGYRFNNEGPHGHKKNPYTRVTTIKGKKGTGSALVDWAARMVAEEVQRILALHTSGSITREQLIVMLSNQDDLGSAHNRVRDAAADFGTVFHDLAEGLAHGDGRVLDIAEASIKRNTAMTWFTRANPKVKNPDDRAVQLWLQKLPKAELDPVLEAERDAYNRLWPDVEAFLDWVSASKVKFIRPEFQVFSDEYGYAGSVDLDCSIEKCRLLLDYKTSKSVYPDYGLQLAAYRHSEFIGNEDGTRAELPDWEAGCILHVRDGQCQLVEVDCGRDAFESFLACHRLYWYDRNAPKDLELFEFAPTKARGDKALADMFGITEFY